MKIQENFRKVKNAQNLLGLFWEIKKKLFLNFYNFLKNDNENDTFFEI